MIFFRKMFIVTDLVSLINKFVKIMGMVTKKPVPGDQMVYLDRLSSAHQQKRREKVGIKMWRK